MDVGLSKPGDEPCELRCKFIGSNRDRQELSALFDEEDPVDSDSSIGVSDIVA